MTQALLRRVVPAGFDNPQSEERQEQEQQPSPSLRVDDSSHTLSIVSSPTAAPGKKHRGQDHDDDVDIEGQRQKNTSLNALFGGSTQRTELEAPSSSDDGADTTSRRVSKMVASRRPSFLLKGPVSHPMGSTQKKWLFVGLILLIGGACAGAFLALGILGAQNDAHKQFEQRSIDLTYGIASAAHDYELFGLWIHESCHNTHSRNEDIPLDEDYAGHLGFCTRTEFRRLHDYIQTVGVEVQALEYVPNISHAERPSVERQSRAYFEANYPHFNYTGITRVVPDKNPGLRTAPEYELPFYFPLHYVEPLLTNEAAVDLNPYSNPARRKAIDRATDSYKPAWSDRLKLVQETDPNAYGLGLIHPGVNSTTEPVDRPTSFSQIIIRIPALLQRAIRHAIEGEEKQIYLFESSDEEDPIFLGAADIDQSNDPPYKNLPEISLFDIPRSRSQHYYEARHQIVDRYWTVVVTSDAYQHDLVYIIVGGVIIFVSCVVLALLFYSHLVRVAKMNKMRSEQEAEKSKAAQQQAEMERELNEFIAHEVRNPLSSAIAALSFVSAAAADKEAGRGNKESLMDDIRIIDASLQFINELLRNMLDIHRASDKHMKLDFQTTDLMRDVFDPVSAILYMRGAKVDILTDCPKNLMVRTDRMRLKQIVLNLAANSTKFVEKGYIRLRAIVENDNVVVAVEDSGPGIPQEKRNRLFAKFQESLDRLNQGTGIGLCVCKNLSELMGADLGLDDTFESGIEGCHGTRFVLSLNQPPIEPQADDSEQSEHDADSNTVSVSKAEENPLPKELNVLFVDDDTVLRKMFSRAVRRVVGPGWKISEASNGETAIRMLKEASEDYDVIFMDHYMAAVEKQLLGSEAVRQLRANGVTSIICGLSANDKEHEFREAGADAFMFKPFPCEQNALRSELYRVLEAGGGLEGQKEQMT